MEENQSQCLRFYTRKRKKNMSDLTTTSDKLSALPESLLHLILSFLDMKQVIQTSCLSTKWRNIWRSVPVLNFNYSPLWKESDTRKRICRNRLMDFVDCNRHMDFVDRVLFLRDDSGIQKLKLSRFFGYDLGRVDTWLLFVVKQQVKEVQLRIKAISEHYHQLPHLLFTSVIEVFEVKIPASRCSVQLPNSMCSATHLRILKLKNIILPKGNSDGELVVKCSFLEEMFLTHCSHHDLKILSICAPQLNNLVIHNCHADSCKIKICTPNLTSLKLILSCYKEYFLESLSSLVTANIEVSELATKFLMTILSGLHNAKTLTISGYGHKTSPGCADLLDQGLNTLSNLRYLEFIGFLPGVRDITNLLKRFPHIETLTFSCCCIEDKEEDWGEVLSMQNMFSHLKYIRVRAFNGCENYVNLLEFLLKTAPGLLDMTITLSKAFSKSKKLDECTAKLHSLPRAASSAIILFT
ncbi:Fbd-associated f-box protein [Thalictrum thalictroides]|uniref:Fbd-associated f-box protein n=1 Tax=Thalictrum thalictroides TaxID=46969 RepID=A0A7J6W6E7_THATH|nr:Fbd-associated f-box protein [Thalictrum thalictroides]